jgi:hypothetical protein
MDVSKIVRDDTEQRKDSVGVALTMRSMMTDTALKNTKDSSMKRIAKYMSEIQNHLDFIKVKNVKWLSETTNLTTSMGVELQDRCNRLAGRKSTVPLVPGEEPRLQKQIYHGYSKMLDVVQEKVDVTFAINKQFFLKTGRKKVQYILGYLDRRQKTAVQNGGAKLEKYQTIKSEFERLISNIEAENDRYYNQLLRLVTNNIHLYGRGGSGVDGVMLLDNGERVRITDKYENIQKDIIRKQGKLKSYYTLNEYVMDLIIDSQFFVLYVIKGLRILFTYIALFLSTRVFSPIYEDIVYDQKKNPPALWKYLFIFIGFDLAFNSFLVVVLFLLQFLFKTDDNSFIIDKYLFYKYLTDYVITMIVLLLVGWLVSKVMMDKKYFKYKYEGLRAIRAYETMIFYIAIPSYMFPYFLLI